LLQLLQQILVQQQSVATDMRRLYMLIQQHHPSRDAATPLPSTQEPNLPLQAMNNTQTRLVCRYSSLLHLLWPLLMWLYDFKLLGFGLLSAFKSLIPFGSKTKLAILCATARWYNFNRSVSSNASHGWAD
jgi:hypothetical protein